MSRKRTVIIAASALVLVLGIVLFPRVHYVDPKPATAFGEKYFSNLKQDLFDAAFEMYTDGFLQKRGDDWRKLLVDLKTKNGSATDFKALSSQVTPVTLHDSTTIPCVLVMYQVTRNTVISHENLTICPNQRGEEWAIAGHEISRTDTGQHFAAGLTIHQETIFATKQ